MFKIDDFVIQNVFNRENAGTDEEYWWASTNDHDGYIIVWFDDDGNETDHFHTYHYPPDFLDI